MHLSLIKSFNFHFSLFLFSFFFFLSVFIYFSLSLIMSLLHTYIFLIRTFHQTIQETIERHKYFQSKWWFGLAIDFFLLFINRTFAIEFPLNPRRNSLVHKNPTANRMKPCAKPYSSQIRPSPPCT